MAMLIAWQALNKVTYPQDKRFSKNILVIAPGLTVKSLLQVLVPGPNSYYDLFRVIPPGLEGKLRQGSPARWLRPSNVSNRLRHQGMGVRGIDFGVAAS